MRTAVFSAKASDTFWASFTKDGTKLGEYEGYVPRGMHVGSGDYFEFEIDLDTGKILNWTPVTEEKVQEILNSDDNFGRPR